MVIREQFSFCKVRHDTGGLLSRTVMPSGLTHAATPPCGPLHNASLAVYRRLSEAARNLKRMLTKSCG